MRLGISGKVFVTYALLLAAFATSSIFTLTYLDRARQHVLAHGELLDIQDSVEAARRHISSFDDAGSGQRAQVLKGPVFALAQDNLSGALATIDRFLKVEGRLERRRRLERYRQDVLDLAEHAAAAQAALGAFLKGPDEQPFLGKFMELKRRLELFTRKAHEDLIGFADDLQVEEERAARQLRGLVVLGLIIAVVTALVLVRSLRPLRILRVRARQMASGDYGRRVGLHSRDEIGDLAREFDAMGQALEERERRLIRSERLATVGKVAAQIAHEIRNPLASVGLNAELLGDELDPGNQEGRRLVASITREVDRLNEITETYLRFVRLPVPKLEREAPGELVTSVVEFVRRELEGAGVVIDLRMAADLPEVSVDENQVRQALLNLLRNAREAMPGGGRLSVAVEADAAGAVVVTVTDTGPGVDPEHRGRVFDAFFSTKDKGTGLGLALVHQIVSEHGGRVDLGSGPTGGAMFTITLPGAGRGESGNGSGPTAGGHPPDARVDGGGDAAGQPQAAGGGEEERLVVPRLSDT
jgi:signal transduction histidine kinase